MAVMMYGFGGGGWPFWEVALMWAGSAVLLGGLIVFAYALTAGDRRWSGGDGRRHGGSAILDARLASGEIDGAEYTRLSGLMAGGEARSRAGTRNRQR
jgi:uncharacterized membrane protein